MSGLIDVSNAEKVRDAVGAIVASELASQKQFSDQLPSSDPAKLNFDLPEIWVERFVAFDADELPAVIVAANQSDYDDNGRTVMDSSATSTYFIDAYMKKRGNDGKKAMKNIQRLLYLIRAILMKPEFVRLGFNDARFIYGRNVSSVVTADPNRENTDNAVMGRVSLSVKMNEKSQLTGAPQLQSAITNVTLAETDEGFVYEYIKD